MWLRQALLRSGSWRQRTAGSDIYRSVTLEATGFTDQSFKGEMLMKNKIDLIWVISLIVIGISAILLAVSNIVGLTLPDIAIRMIGVLDIIALPVLIVATVKKLNINRTQR